jgi:hypothetical protein
MPGPAGRAGTDNYFATKVAAITEELIANAAKKQVYVGALAGRSPSTTIRSSRSR